MKRNLTIGLIVLFILSGIRLFAQDVLIKENRPVSSFSAIKVGGIAHVYLTRGETEKVDVEVNNKDFNDRLIVEVVNNVLVIRMKQSENGKGQNYGNAKVRINVSYKNLNKIDASGVTHVYGESLIESDKVDIGMSGVSTVKLNVKSNELNIDGSGTSNITLTGSTKRLTAKTSGVSNIKAYDLSAEDVISESSGASNIYVSASKTLSAKASGASNVNYKGDAKVDNNESSIASRVRKM
ncbi:head GIN domain-containing protein [Daejeonella lutea]|nr:head GIN domain-containing protein [Daejeonella lutea]